MIQPGSQNNNFANINCCYHTNARNCRALRRTFDEFHTISNLNLALFKNQNFENLETKAKLRYEKVITNDLKHNSYLRNRRKVKSIVTTLRKDKNLCSMTTNDYETAECFADAFSSVFTREPLGPLP